jgi:acyl carrier protein
MSGLQQHLRATMAGHLGIAVAQLEDDVALADIGLDSIQIVEMVISLEHWAGRSLDLSEVAVQLNGNPTVGEFLALLEERLGAGSGNARHGTR